MGTQNQPGESGRASQRTQCWSKIRSLEMHLCCSELLWGRGWNDSWVKRIVKILTILKPCDSDSIFYSFKILLTKDSKTWGFKILGVKDCWVLRC